MTEFVEPDPEIMRHLVGLRKADYGVDNRDFPTAT